MKNEEIILTSELNDLLNNVELSKNDTLKMCSQDKRFEGFNEKYILKLAQKTMEIKKLREQYPDLTASDFFKLALSNFLTPVVSQIKEEYGEYLTPDKINKLDLLANGTNIIIINDPNNRHDFSANSDSGQIIINEAQMGKQQQAHELEQVIAVTMGTTIHETFHILINMLKKPNEVNERMIFQLENGETVHFAPGKVGQIVSEGFVEKLSMEFAQRNNFYYCQNPYYVPYVDVCTYLMNNYSNIDSKYVMTHDYEDLYKQMTPDTLDRFEDAERTAMLNHFQVVEYSGKKDENGHQLLVNPNYVVNSYTEGDLFEKNNSMNKIKIMKLTPNKMGYINKIVLASLITLSILGLIIYIVFQFK